ncbi:DUF6992 family protein [Hymenobacter arizonensis]|uniref:Uncharacterized protein n=1 Tax=Hymenobacter arizonensis TaxID=1227077 RepID=A0A1I6AFB9_HYMAR|nr:hypothetical protein [Hymenobacter arizonensis]SFQ67351.1 hypothetical protein SAMN04515668_3619 [Hymenobacter arizonensis]
MPDIASLLLASELLIGRGLAVLAAWALLNLVVSGYMVANADRRHEPYHFHSMNVGWGLVNAGLACWGILHLHFTAPVGLRLADLLQSQLVNENLFIFNTGLDAAYIMTGFYLQALARQPEQAHPTRLRGFGRSLWLQGGFLLVFDAVMWGLLHWQGQAWLPLMGT